MSAATELMARRAAFGGAKRAPEGFVITFTSGTTPSFISLNASYAGPKTASLALYDSGDGVWTAYTSRTIPVKGNYVAFKGDWRNSAGTYAYMFKSTLADAAYTCRFSGAFTEYPTHTSAYREMFRDCSSVTEIADNPIPNLVGSPSAYMFAFACYGMANVTTLPENFLNTSGLTGAPATRMFNAACFGMANVTSLPANFLNTSGLVGAPSAYMFYSACQDMAKVTTLPENFLNTSGLTGAPATRMFASACQGMANVTNAYVFRMSPNITFTPENVASSGALSYSFQNMTKFPGSVMWGDQNLFTAFTPTADVNTIQNSPLIQGYTEAGANWK